MKRQLLIVTLFFAAHTHAQIPVTDGLGLAEKIKANVDSATQVISGAKRLVKLGEQYKKQVETLDNMMGSYNKGNILSDWRYRKARRTIGALWRTNNELFSASSEVAASLGISKPQVDVINRSLSKKEVAGTLMERADNLTSEAEVLASHIENSPSLKAAQDLSNRIQVQNQFVNLEVLQGIALLLESLAETNLERERGRIADIAMANGR